MSLYIFSVVGFVCRCRSPLHLVCFANMCAFAATKNPFNITWKKENIRARAKYIYRFYLLSISTESNECVDFFLCFFFRFFFVLLFVSCVVWLMSVCCVAFEWLLLGVSIHDTPIKLAEQYITVSRCPFIPSEAISLFILGTSHS